MAEHFLYLVGIILVTGLIGGGAAWLSEPQPPSADPPLPSPPLKRFLLLGLIAAACVPLFLSLLKSGLVDGIIKSPAQAPAYEYYLIFIGLCLIAAFSARRFIDSITAQVIRRLDQVDAKAGAAAADAAEAREVAHEAVEEVEASENEGDAQTELPEMSRAEGRVDVPAQNVTADERNALQAMTKRSLRTATGIAEDSGISRNRVSELLESLADKGLAERTVSPKTKGPRWRITPSGIVALNARSGGA